MSLSQDVLMDLMAYADGELEGEARARVEDLLATNEEARGVVAAMGTLGDVVRNVTETRAASGGDGIAAAVMAKIDSAPIDLARVRARRARVVGSAAAIAALAAGYLLFVRESGAPATDGIARSTPGMTASPAIVPSIAFQNAPAPEDPGELAAGVDVDHVEAPNNEVSVIYVPAVAAPNANASSVVIWITDDIAPGGH